MYELSYEKNFEIPIFMCFSQVVKFSKPVNRALFAGSKPVKKPMKKPVKYNLLKKKVVKICEKESCFQAFYKGVKSQNV